MTTTPAPSIRRAAPADLTTVSTVLSEAFLHGDIAPWLIDPLDDRQRIYPPYFTLLAEHALEHGHVDTTDDDLAVALWYAHPEQTQAEIPDYATRLAQITQPYTARFVALDDAQARNHPDEPHHYLALLAVHPERQGRGYGSRLLRHHHHRLDLAGIPAYLEATGRRNQGLYAQHGYQKQPPFHIAGRGPLLYPMRRPPQPPDPSTDQHPAT